ncbi:lytic transglycosylase [Streptomyces echinoruber]|uniref:Lytic transglycosylase n=1 Tax=Streptomyces echinoruber TaxID=68898 RepID=A0A918QTM7_9ACTN|nr:lytic transglycosylase [Streptomyces echinoruber]
MNADDSATGNSPYYTDLPPLNSPNPSPGTSTPPTAGPTPAPGATEAGIPATVLDAYKRAAAALREAKPGCNLPWELLAAIGKVESGQANGGRVGADGTTFTPILGPKLDGNGFALIKDTDGGAYDGDSAYDRAVGPMQFIPSTWAWAGRDGNGDGRKDPNNIYDAALATGHYLCRDGRDLSVQADIDRAVLSYNNSQDYLNTVMSWFEYYRKGTHSIPDGTGSLPSGRSDRTTGSGGKGGNSAKNAKNGSKHRDENGKNGGKNGGGDKKGTESPKPSPGPGGKGDTPGSPTPTPPGGGTTSPAPTPTDTVDHLEDAGTGQLTARAGDTFAKRIATRAETSDGKPVAKVRIRFTVTGDTDAAFTGGEKTATVLTDASGVAAAPALQAGEKTGTFTVRAVVVGRTVSGVTYTATVTPRAADTLTRTSDTPLTCIPGGTFEQRVQVKATYRKAVADGVAATATLVKSATDPAVNDKGPYFKDASGKAVRTLSGLTTDKDGLLTLPRLYADDTAGTFLLRITTTGGATLTVELTVKAAEASPNTSSSPSASATVSAPSSPSLSA